MIFEELLNVIHSITQIKISPDIQNDISIPELERVKGSEFATQLSMNSLSLMWQVLFKGFQELQNGFHLFQHGEMIIVRLIFINNSPNPEPNKKNSPKKIDQPKLETSDNVVKKKIDIENSPNIIDSPIKKETENTTAIQISNFRQFVDYFYMKREALLHAQLYNSVKLISFKEGEVTINTSSLRDPHFNRNVAKLISTWTGRIWQIHSSDSNVGSSLSEEDVVNQQNEIKVMKNHPEIKKVLEALPGLSIHSITDIVDTVDETLDENNTVSQKEV